MPANDKVTNKQLIAYWYSQNVEDLSSWTCKCGTTRKQIQGSGYTNLMTHLKQQHADDYETAVIAARGDVVDGTRKITTHFNSKGANLYGWLDWVIQDNEPITFVERRTVRQYSVLKPISRATLKRYIEEITKRVEVRIRSGLPNGFGLMMDGWSEGTTHYIGLFAAYEVDNEARRPLLAIAPPYDETHLDARGQYDFIGDVLELFGKEKSNVLYLVADNASVNRATADLLGVPLIGCASHKLNLDVQDFYRSHERVLDKINGLMKTLRTLKQAGKLRRSTDLSPIIRNVTRWTSTFAMMSRYLELEPFLDQNDEAIVDNILGPRDKQQLASLVANSRLFEAVTEKLQKESITLAEVSEKRML